MAISRYFDADTPIVAGSYLPQLTERNISTSSDDSTSDMFRDG